MKIRRNLLFFAVILFIMQSCGPAFRMGDKKIKKIKNIHDITTIKKSRLNFELERQRRKKQLKKNKQNWKKQMKNRYKH